jgi:hypothetical protein
MSINTYYTILGITECATFEEIQKAYRQKALLYHPDKNKSDNAHDIFIKIQKAYEVLSDPERRSKYDNDLNSYRQNIFNSINTDKTNRGKSDIENIQKQKKSPINKRSYKREKTSINSKNILIFICISIITIYIAYHANLFNINNHNTDTINPTQRIDDYVEEVAPMVEEVEDSNIYKNNHLMNGDSPFTEYFGINSYDDSQDNYITVNNGSDQDAVVILKNITSKKIIRNVYINKHTSYDIRNIPEGIYEMKCVYGNDWNPNLLFNGMKLGMFQSNVHYSSQANYKDYFNMFSERTENGISIPYYEVTLHKVSNGNMRTKKINQSDFFEK